MKPFYILTLLLCLTACGSFTPVAQKTATGSDDEVNIGYGTVSKDQLTASVSKVKTDDADSVPYQNIYEMLQGKCPGVVVYGTSVTIRGLNSINSSTEPLFILDGSPVTNISSINPRDVKSIEVLKDAASCAIYGSRGANGVIIITTKR